MKKPLQTAAGIARHIKKGHGQGHGEHYKPWLEVRHVPSLGKSTRNVGWKTGRMHSFLSQLELQVFYLLDWEDEVVDIREQFPLFPQEKTKEICHLLGIKDPQEPQAEVPMVMTTDFLVTLRDGSEHARSVKYVQELEDPRTVTKQEIERVFWEQSRIDWKIITENDVNITAVKNVEWLHPKRAIGKLHPMTEREVNTVRRNIEPEIFAGFRPLNEITSEADEKLGYRSGSALSIVRHLLANKVWLTDMTQRLEPSNRIQITPYETAQKHSIRVA